MNRAITLGVSFFQVFVVDVTFRHLGIPPQFSETCKSDLISLTG